MADVDISLAIDGIDGAQGQLDSLTGKFEQSAKSLAASSEQLVGSTNKLIADTGKGFESLNAGATSAAGSTGALTKSVGEGFDSVSKGADAAAKSTESLTKSAEQALSKSVGGMADKVKEMDVVQEKWSLMQTKLIALTGVAVTTTAAIAAVGAAGVGLGFLGMGDADAMNTMALQTGIAVEQLSKFKYIAQQTDTDFNTLVGSVARFQTTLRKALATGKGDMPKALAELGVSAQALINMDAGAQIIAIATAIDKLGSQEDKIGAIGRIFGPGAAKNLAPFFSEGAKGIAALSDELAKFGGVITTKTAKDSDAFFDNLNKMGAALGAVRTQIAGGISDDMMKLSAAFVHLTKNTSAIRGLAIILEAAAKVLLFVVKVIATVVIAIQNVIGDVATVVDTLRRALKAIVTLQFKEAGDIIKQSLSDMGARSLETEKAIKDLWGLLDKAPNIEGVDAAVDSIKGAGKEAAAATKSTQQLAGAMKEQNKEANSAASSTDKLGTATKKAGEEAKTLGSKGKAGTKELKQGVDAAADSLKKMNFTLKQTGGLMETAFSVDAQSGLMQVAGRGTFSKRGSAAKKKEGGDVGDTAQELNDETEEKSIDWFATMSDEDKYADLLQAVDGFARDFTNKFTDMLTSSEASFEDFLDSIVKLVSATVVQEAISKPIAGFVSGLMGSVMSGFSPGAGSGGIGGGGYGGGSPVMYKAAAGGVLPAGYASLVGEEGEELAIPEAPSRIIPNKVLSQLGMGGGRAGGNEVTVIQNFSSGLTATDLLRILPTIQQQTIAAVQDAQRRGGVFA